MPDSHEDRALDALIVMALRRRGGIDKFDPKYLAWTATGGACTSFDPELTPEEKAALDELGPDFVQRCWDKAAEAVKFAAGFD